MARKFKVVGADGTVNANNRKLNISGIDYTGYMQNPVVLANHNNSVFDIIGTVSSIYINKKDDCIIFEGEFADTDKGRYCADLYEKDLLKSVSLGYTIEEGEFIEEDIYHVKKCILNELSFVAVGANQNALKISDMSDTICVDSFDIKKTSFNKKEGIDNKIKIEVKDNINNSLKDFIKNEIDSIFKLKEKEFENKQEDLINKIVNSISFDLLLKDNQEEEEAEVINNNNKVFDKKEFGDFLKNFKI